MAMSAWTEEGSAVGLMVCVALLMVSLGGIAWSMERK